MNVQIDFSPNLSRTRKQKENTLPKTVHENNLKY